MQGEGGRALGERVVPPPRAAGTSPLQPQRANLNLREDVLCEAKHNCSSRAPGQKCQVGGHYGWASLLSCPPPVQPATRRLCSHGTALGPCCHTPMPMALKPFITRLMVLPGME